MSWFIRNKFKVIAGSGLLALHQFDTHYRYERFNRNVRTFVAAAATVWDYKVELDRHPDDVEEIHARVAKRWYELCRGNGGLYIKLGQSVSLMSHVMPPQFSELFAELQDKAPYVDYEAVCEVFREDYNGQVPTDLFLEFDHEPVASASIAQVHRAKLQDGTEVAVKVQKPNIRYQMPFDLFCYRIATWAFEKTFDLPLYWTTDEVCDTITREADFKAEAQFTKQARVDLMGNVDKVYVPLVYDKFTRTRVMVQEWIPGVKLSRYADIANMGFALKPIMTTVMSAFGHQLFVSGRVHGDPHPGNILVRPDPNNSKEYQVVIIDHGLYVIESEGFRQTYCKLWKSMVLGDFDQLKEVCTSWGIQDSEMFASMQLFKPFRKHHQGSTHFRKTSRTEMLEMQVRAKERVRELLKETHKIPRELIMLGRTLNCLRANNKQAGSIVNRINLFARMAVKGDAVTRNEQLDQGVLKVDRSRWQLASAQLSVFWFRTRLLVIELVHQSVLLWRSINLFFTRRDVGGMEEVCCRMFQGATSLDGMVLCIDHGKEYEQAT
eukprot:m.88452 g.88452  ORF g.88452 m.88452 type:complete len:550 (+) comp14832_c0_seq2:1271-2920(+)